MMKGEHAFDIIPPSLSRGLSKGFSRNSTISKDTLKRAKSKNLFQCPVEHCGRVFDRKYNMQIHIRKHTGEMPYQCRVQDCGFRFKWRSSLVNHNKKHQNGELPGAPDPTLLVGAVRQQTSKDDNFTEKIDEHQQSLARLSTAPCNYNFDDLDILFAKSELPRTPVRTTVQSTRTAGDLAVSEGRQNHNDFLPYLPNDMTPIMVTETIQPYKVEFAQMVSQADEAVTPFDIYGSGQRFNTDVDNEFIDRFAGALTCDFDSQVIEEVLDNHFASPVSDIFHDSTTTNGHFGIS